MLTFFLTVCKRSDTLTFVVKGEWLNGRAAVSKTAGCVFESCLHCHTKDRPGYPERSFYYFIRIFIAQDSASFAALST